MNWYLEVLKKYATFNGRARRKEYWFFALFNLIFTLVAAVVDNLLGTVSATGVGLLGTIYLLGVLIPALAVTVRRLHDTGRSGWWLLIVLVPVIGPIVLLVFMVLDSKPETNEYGANPKAAAA